MSVTTLFRAFASSLHFIEQGDVSVSDCEAACLIFALQMVVTITFNFLNTQYSDDYVYVYDGYNTSSQSYTVLTGNFSTPRTMSSSQRYMYIRFTAFTSGMFRGFSATFQSTCESSQLCVRFNNMWLNAFRSERPKCFYTH